MKNKLVLSLIALMLLGSTTTFAQRRGRMQRRVLPQKEMALQLYSIREVIGDADKYAKNHVDVFKRLKAMGYTGVEAANYGDGKFYGVSPEQYRKDVEAAGLKPISSHATRALNDQELENHDFTAALKWWDEAIKAHKAAGMKYIVTPWASVPKTLKDAQTLCDYHNAIGKKCKAAGLLYGYHSHSHEFAKVEGQDWYEYFVSHTNPEYVFFQMDVYWAMMAQQSPTEWFRKHPGRFKMLHIKDKYVLGESGMVGFDGIFKYADKAGLQDFVVEMEGTEGGMNIMEGVRLCARYIQKAPFVKRTYTKQ